MKYWNNFKELVWYDKIIAMPGLLIVGTILLVVSPILLFIYMISVVSDVFDLD